MTIKFYATYGQLEHLCAMLSLMQSLREVIGPNIPRRTSGTDRKKDGGKPAEFGQLTLKTRIIEGLDMLQKLLIALCTIFVLSACGGDLDLGPDSVPGQDPNNPGDPGEEPEEPEEPAEPRILVFVPFNEDAQTDDWMTRCEEACNATAELTWNESEEVLAIEPEWASEEDQLEVYSPIAEVNDLEGSHISAWVFVTEDYATDGNLAAHLVLGNAADGTAYSRAFEVSEGWNRIEMWEMMAGTGETVTDEEGEESVDYGTFFWHSEGFTLRNVNEFGVAFAANGKATDVTGQLWLDNVTVTPASGTGPLIVEADDEAWTVMDAAPEVTVQRDGEGGVYYEPTAADQKLVYLLEGPADLVGRSFDMTFTVDQAFKDSGADVQPIIQQNFGSYTGEFGCYVGNGSLTAGEPYEVTCATENEAFVAEEGQNIRVGLQVKNQVAGRVTINSMQINVVSSSDSGPFALTPTQENVDDGTWSVDNYSSLEGVAELSYNADESALSIAPNWQVTDPGEQYNEGERTVFYLAEEEELPDLEGATVGVELYLGDYYTTENPGLALQIFIQQNSDSYAGSYGSNIAVDAAEDLGDGWYRFEREMEDVPTEPLALRVGMKLQGGGLETREEAAEPILLRSITIE